MSSLGDMGSFLKTIIGTFIFGIKNAPLVYIPILIFVVLIIILIIFTGRKKLSKTNFPAEPKTLMKKKFPPRPPFIK
ncbi:MAG: hypothetical protein PHE59_03450 [Patescibacteria group bacterium]|nr:hypothetical protein [Patescibacteria group bacterium]MDD5164233.1 hypothetical protein [Patescibacteria group bacterium]MDD5534651.1 hypothetical protein [Patescibacteria group bacterium]